MNTPICDFVQQYTEKNSLRFHMPGHKGTAFLGMEPLDITEIEGADSLYETDGIILQSEENASRLFGCHTFYSTEGSSQCIRAMLYLALLHAKQNRKPPLIAAGRNAHKTFLSAAALLDLDVAWLQPLSASYLSCAVDAAYLEHFFQTSAEKPAAVYLTNPDYLGSLIDITGIARVCHKHEALLLIDNAHGAYLRFLPASLHPIDLGADLCCSSAHKTLPVLTGGAYLHLSRSFPNTLVRQTKNALALFGSTSPSYLILQSLDAANAYLDAYPQKLRQFLSLTETLKNHLTAHGYILYGNEPLKLTLYTKPYGYTGLELSHYLSLHNIVCEFADPDYLVLMLTPELGAQGLDKLEKVLLAAPRRKTIDTNPPAFHAAEKVMSIREAALSVSETLPISDSYGRILASATVGCPPAVPILVCGERIDSHTLTCFRYYGIDHCTVVCE